MAPWSISQYQRHLHPQASIGDLKQVSAKDCFVLNKVAICPSRLIDLISHIEIIDIEHPCDRIVIVNKER